MPEKTYLWTLPTGFGVRRSTLLFKLGRRSVSQRRVQSLVVVVAVQEFLHMRLQIAQVFVFTAVNLFDLQSFHE